MTDLTKISCADLDGETLSAKAEYEAAWNAETEARAAANAARREVSRLSRIRYSAGRKWDACRNEQTRRSNMLDNIGH